MHACDKNNYLLPKRAQCWLMIWPQTLHCLRCPNLSEEIIKLKTPVQMLKISLTAHTGGMHYIILYFNSV